MKGTRLFEMSEYSKKVLESLKKLEETQSPGEKSGKGNKTAVIESVKPQIQAMIKNGYTIKQISDALSRDVFGILPKTITQLIGAKSSSKKLSVKRTAPASVQVEKLAVVQQRKKPVTEISDVE